MTTLAIMVRMTIVMMMGMMTVMASMTMMGMMMIKMIYHYIGDDKKLTIVP